MDVKAIPAFYCCYLLRSTTRHASLYVGSTPNPPRRLEQHNGKIKGGAVRTSRVSLRPWEMTCIVAGFPSNIAALQFEWAWHNAHLTRHITPDERISFATTRTKTKKTGKVSTRPGRPRTSLTDKLSNLHLLLRVPYFSQWPLEVCFFSEEVYKVWQKWCDRVDGNIRSGIKVYLDPPQTDSNDLEITSGQQSAKRRKIDLLGKGGVEGVDPTYARFQDVLEKSRLFLDEVVFQSSGVCAQRLDMQADLYTICPHSTCRELSHVTCLSQKFTEGDGEASFLPQHGKCPSCYGPLEWSELMRDVSLRARGKKEVRKLLSKKRKTKAATAAEIMETDSEEDAEEAEEQELTSADVVDDDFEEDDNMSVTSMDSAISRPVATPDKLKSAKPPRLEIVIEDSESDFDMR
jgi:structure-specific endonuclease subunit SLX1